jgi:hypothetical protein
MHHLDLFRLLDKAFKTEVKNATKTLNVQLFSAIIVASICGIRRMSKIVKFRCDSLVRKLLGLNKGLDDRTMKSRLGQPGRRGGKHNAWRQESKTFRAGFIVIPGRVVIKARKTTVKMSKHYMYAEQWQRLACKIMKIK